MDPSQRPGENPLPSRPLPPFRELQPGPGAADAPDFPQSLAAERRARLCLAPAGGSAAWKGEEQARLAGAGVRRGSIRSSREPLSCSALLRPSPPPNSSAASSPCLPASCWEAPNKAVAPPGHPKSAFAPSKPPFPRLGRFSLPCPSGVSVPDAPTPRPSHPLRPRWASWRGSRAAPREGGGRAGRGGSGAQRGRLDKAINMNPCQTSEFSPCDPGRLQRS